MAYGRHSTPPPSAATLKGLYSREVAAASNPPAPAPPTFDLAFDRACLGAVCTYKSKDSFVASRIPGYSLREPVAPQMRVGARVVPVEVGGLVEGRIQMGTAGLLNGLVDVSGAEILTPGEGSIQNLTKQGVTAPSRASRVSGQVARHRLDEDVAALERARYGRLVEPAFLSAAQPALPAGRRRARSSSSTPGRAMDHVFTIDQAQDELGHVFSDEAATFVYTEGLVANPAPLTPEQPGLSPSNTWLARGRFLAPAVETASISCSTPRQAAGASRTSTYRSTCASTACVRLPSSATGGRS